MRMGVARALRDFTVSHSSLEGEVGFDVEQAESGEQALEIVSANPPDILLLDHKLPGKSGIEVLEEVASGKHPVLTVMITAYASIETAVRATKSGAYDFLAKPFTPAELKNTVRKAAENILVTRQAQRLAEEKRQVRFQFISVLAHELKAPLGAVEGYLHVIRDGAAEDPEMQKHVLDRCLTRVEFMRKMIIDLLDLTRIESGQKRRELSEVNVREVAEMAVETAAPQAQEREIAVHLHAPDEILLDADRGELEIIFNNLISNAVKYNRDGGKVDVTLEREDGAVRINVADTGIGMTHEEAARLFNDFMRIKNDKTRDILGSGLGLSIVKKLAQLYHGDVSVHSEPDVGSTFTVRLRPEAAATPTA
jgi:signal transduction histidine kinase